MFAIVGLAILILGTAGVSYMAIRGLFKHA